jgi:hypothetical protein
LFRVFDTDGNGVIDVNEFLAGAALLSNGTLEEKAEGSMCFHSVFFSFILLFSKLTK